MQLYMIAILNKKLFPHWMDSIISFVVRIRFAAILTTIWIVRIDCHFFYLIFDLFQQCSLPSLICSDNVVFLLLFLMLFFLLNVVLDFTNYNTHTCISSSVTPKSADNYIAVYIGVGAFVVTALVAVIVFATLR